MPAGPVSTSTPRVPEAGGSLRLNGFARPGRVGGVAVGQLVAVQVAVIAAVATYQQSDWVFVPVVLAAAGIAAASFGTRDGHWWYEHAWLRWRFSRRRRRRPAPHGDPRLAGLDPSLSLGEVTDRGTTFGVGVDEAGWFVVIAVLDPVRPDIAPFSLIRLLTGTSVPVSTVQVVEHRTAPVRVPGGVRAPAAEQAWVVLRVDVAQAPAAAADRGGGLDGVHRTLAAAVGRVAKLLRTEGVRYRMLRADEVAAALVTVAGGDAVDRPAPVEHWRAWWVGDVAHVCFQLHGAFGPVFDGFVAELARTSALSFTVSVAHTSGVGGEPALTGLLRIAAGGDGLDDAVVRAAEAAAAAGVELRRLDGEHGVAVYAVAPTGCVTGPGAPGGHGRRALTARSSRSSHTHRRSTRRAAPR